MNYEYILTKIWLSDEESKVYIDLLENWISSIVSISNRTYINRPALYKILPNLVEIWLIWKVIKWKRNVYKAESPKNLKRLFDSLSNTFNAIVPDLEEMYESNSFKPSVRFFEWVKGLKFIFEDILNSLNYWDTYYRYSSRNVFWQKYYPLNYTSLIDEKWIFRYLITSEKLYSTKIPKARREIVVIPNSFDLFEDNLSKIIYKNKVAIVDYNSLTWFIIENPLFARFEEKLFKLLFKLMKNIWY